MCVVVKLLNLLLALLYNCFKRELFFDHLTEKRGSRKLVKKRPSFVKSNFLGIETLKFKQQCGCRSEGAEHAAIRHYKLQALTAFSDELC